jgi:uncharacterized protein (TIGR03083 family)
MPVMEIDEHIAALERQGQLLADAADRAGPGAVVPTCPGWRVRDVIRHTGYVHRWATGYVAGQLTEMVPELTEDEQFAAGPADDKLTDWYLSGLTGLAAALSQADPAMTAWTFLPAPSPRAFWARRQAHETAIHRADAEAAAGGLPDYPAEFAADGVDELLIGFFGRDAARAGAGTAHPDDGRVLEVRAADTGQSWHVRVSRDASRLLATGRGTRQDRPAADCTISGPASGLYLLLWNRADPATAGVAVSGEASLLEGWVSNMHVTWA